MCVCVCVYAGMILGQGAFGRVMKAEAIGIGDSQDVITVAVKMVKGKGYLCFILQTMRVLTPQLPWWLSKLVEGRDMSESVLGTGDYQNVTMVMEVTDEYLVDC